MLTKVLPLFFESQCIFIKSHAFNCNIEISNIKNQRLIRRICLRHGVGYSLYANHGMVQKCVFREEFLCAAELYEIKIVKYGAQPLLIGYACDYIDR